MKNQRKATHKKWKLKEGSQYEDFALIAALAKTVTYIDSLRGTVIIPSDHPRRFVSWVIRWYDLINST